MEIRKAQIADIPQIGLVFKESIEQLNAPYYSEKQIRAWSNRHRDIDMWQYKIAHEHFLVAVNEQHVITAFAAIRLDSYLDFLFTHPKYAQMGLASALLGSMENWSILHHKKSMQTHASKCAKPFFEAKGFQLLHKDKNLINGIALENYLMEKQL